MPRVFFITGTTSGFGRALVEEVLANGDIAVATTRRDLEPFKGANDSNFLALRLDINEPSSISASFDSAIEKFGRVDVVVNNAGYGLAGALEELSDEQIRAMMDVNFLGVLHCTQAAIRTLREKNNPPGGLIQQVSSIGGQLGMPLFSIYCASKFAVEGMTEAVQKEMKPEWNIKFMLVEPGGFRTDWIGRSMAHRDESQALKAYDHVKAEDVLPDMASKQVGDPVKGAKAMYQMALQKDPPLRVQLGSEAFDAMEFKVNEESKNLGAYRDVAREVDVDDKNKPK